MRRSPSVELAVVDDDQRVDRVAGGPITTSPLARVHPARALGDIGELARRQRREQRNAPEGDQGLDATRHVGWLLRRGDRRGAPRVSPAQQLGRVRGKRLGARGLGDRVAMALRPGGAEHVEHSARARRSRPASSARTTASRAGSSMPARDERRGAIGGGEIVDGLDQAA